MDLWSKSHQKNVNSGMADPIALQTLSKSLSPLNPPVAKCQNPSVEHGKSMKIRLFLDDCPFSSLIHRDLHENKGYEIPIYISWTSHNLDMARKGNFPHQATQQLTAISWNRHPK